METTGYNRQNISDRTGFDLGDQFTSEQQLRDYFRREQLADCLGATEADALPAQDVLDEMADTVLAERWHCTF